MVYINAILGWAGVLAIGLFIAGLFYVDVLARRLLVRVAREDTPDTFLRSAAEIALSNGFRARVDWLKLNHSNLQGDASVSAQMTLRVYAWCWIALAALFGLWTAAMLMPNA